MVNFRFETFLNVSQTKFGVICLIQKIKNLYSKDNF